MEKELRLHRERAFRLLKENRGQSRDGIEVLVRDRLGRLAAVAHPEGPALSADQLETLYHEALDLSFLMFSLGYTMAHTLDPKQPAAR